MQDIKDCKGRLTCRGDALTGLVESLYKGQLTSTILSPCVCSAKAEHTADVINTS